MSFKFKSLFRRALAKSVQLSSSLRVEEDDVFRMFGLVLGRNPEARSVIDAHMAVPLSDGLRGILGSTEFQARVLDPIRSRRHPRGGLFEHAPEPELRRWAARRLPLGRAASQAVEAAPNWIALYKAVLSDDVFRAAVAFDPPGVDDALEGLDALMSSGCDLVGAIEEMAGTELHGWALDLADPDRRPTLELRIDGRAVSFAKPDRFRRDLQDRYGGEGFYGFVLPLPREDAFPVGADAEVREVQSGASLGRIQLRSDAPLLGLTALADEVVLLRRALDRIERSMPVVAQDHTFPLSRYSDYAARFYGPAIGSHPLPAQRRAPAGGRAITVVADLSEANLRGIDLLLRSIQCQSEAASAVILVGEPASDVDAAVLDDLIRRFGWRDVPIRRAGKTECSGVAWAAAVELATTLRILLLEAGRVLAPDAIAAFSEALDEWQDAGLIYADEDMLQARADGPRTDPVFRPGFDLDLLRQLPYICGAAAIRAERNVPDLFRALLGRRTMLSQAALALERGGTPIHHLSRIVCSRLPFTAHPPAEIAAEWRMVISERAALEQPDLEIGPHADLLGAVVPEALSIRQPALARGKTAAIIIPTRDQPKLLAGAISSIAEHRGQNTVASEITIVDNGSAQAETLELLQRLSREGIRILRFEGEFNWALLNNRAVDESQADILVFLNDDVLVIAPDWLDRLCEYAVREDVGAVGARLVYAKGPIQHAGIVLRGAELMPIHEGVGAAPADPGYLGRNALTRRTIAVTGACLATRRLVFRELGGFDSASFPVDANDIDYCLRVNDHGLKVIYTPNATLSHRESMSRGYSTSGRKKEVADAAGAALASRWGRRFPHDPFYNAHFALDQRPFAYLRPPLRDLPGVAGVMPTSPSRAMTRSKVPRGG